MAKQPLSEVVGVRLTRKDLRKLDKLAQVTAQGRADVRRCLIRHAEAAEHPDLILGRAQEIEAVGVAG
jgi:hypothetical protein